MADSKLQDLTATTAPAASDVLYIVVDPSGTPLDRKVTLTSLFGIGVTPGKFTALTVPGAGSGSELFGLSAAAAGANALAVGKSASAAGGSSVAVGQGASAGNTGNVAVGQGADALGAGGGQAVAIGQNASAADWRATAIGWSAQTTAVSATAIGRGARAQGAHAIAIGRGAWAADENQIAIGFNGSGGAASHIYFESGHTHKYDDPIDSITITRAPASTPIVIHGFDAYDATGTPTNDVAGGDLLLAAGVGTGTAAGGSVILQTAAAGGVSNNTKNTLVDRVEVFSNGDVEVLTAGAGLIVRSDNGTRYRIGVSDAGVLAATAL